MRTRLVLPALTEAKSPFFRPARTAPRQLGEGFWRACRDFYRWRGILRGAAAGPARSSVTASPWAAGSLP